MEVNFNDNKAGMTGLDKDKIQKIIASNTGKEFNSHSIKQKQRIDERIARNRELLESLTKQQIVDAEQQMDFLAEAIEAERKLDRIKVHIDMDMYFAAVEMRDDPKLRYVPMAVGGDSMLSTSNYIARKFGVRSAMPGFIARKLCPELVIVAGHFSKYKKESSVVREIFQMYDENVRMGSLDEACLDLTSYLDNRKSSAKSSRQKRIRYDKESGCICRLPLLEEAEAPTDALFEVEACIKCGMKQRAVIDYVEFGNDVEDVVNEIRFLVEQRTGLTCSAGIAANWRLSKICSDINKPNGQFLLPSNRDSIIDFMRNLPIRKVSGVGAVTEAILKSMDVNLCGDLFVQRGILKLLFSELSSNWFLNVALGASDSSWSSDTEEDNNRKSISVERTFTPQKDLKILLDTAKHLSQKLIEHISRSEITGGKAVTLKIKFASFDVITRCQSVDFVVSTVDTLFPVVEALLRKELKTPNSIRLLGVRLSRLQFLNSDASDQHESARKTKASQKSLMDFVWKKKERLNTSDDHPVVELSSDEEEVLRNSIGDCECLEPTTSSLGDVILVEEPQKEVPANKKEDSFFVCSEKIVLPTLNRKRTNKKPLSEKDKNKKKDLKESLTRYFPIDLS